MVSVTITYKLEFIENYPGIPNFPQMLGPSRMSLKKLNQWMKTLYQHLNKLDDEDDGQMVKIIFRMIQIEARKRWRKN
ncbi:hypothetical protein FOCG_17253 [Fusarium oxysporum f. sp. radicis-lycopersici 26381]|nr:hypothetical protein FOCG_17253 [Fusarium oxysporum f. sp. radicis-lycopersici 26381]